MEITIRKSEKSDWKRISEIYTQGIEEGKSTFETQCPDYETWDANHLRECRFVACENGTVVGWCAIGSVSKRAAYKGVAEHSIYIDRSARGKGVGTKLLNYLCEESEKCGYWCLFSAVFAVNEPSLILHKKCGFREIGYREKIAKDRFGNWQNTVLLERRNKIM